MDCACACSGSMRSTRLAVAGEPGGDLLDYDVRPDATEFTLPELKTYAVIDLSDDSQHEMRTSCGTLWFFRMCAGTAQTRYDLLLQGGHVIDRQERHQRGTRRGHQRRQDRGRGGRTSIPRTALKVVNVAGLVRHAGPDRYSRSRVRRHGRAQLLRRDNSVYPDGFTFRVGVTTVADAGCAGWRNFEDFKQRVIDRSQDAGARVPQYRRRRHARRRSSRTTWTDMQAEPAAEMAQELQG